MLTPEPVAIFIPSLYRPHYLERVIANIHDMTSELHKIYFVIAEDDFDSQDILDHLDEKYWTDSGDMRFPTRIQFLYEHTTEPWFLTGADDVVFYPRWLTNAFEAIQPNHCVVTFEDYYNRKGTNFLIRRKYIDEVGGVADMPPGNIYYPGYKHNFSDDELVNTAIMRDAYLRVPDAIVEHLHWAAGKGVYDDTYQYAIDAWHGDEAIYNSRSHLWGGRPLFKEL